MRESIADILDREHRARMDRNRLLEVDWWDDDASGGASSPVTPNTLRAAAGNFTLTGRDASLVYAPVGSFILSAGTGTFTLTGDSMTPLVDHRIPASAGSFSMTGQDATLTKAGGADPFALDGTPVTANTTASSVNLTGFSTTYPCVVYVAMAHNGGAPVSVTGGGLTFALRASSLNGATTISLYSAVAASPLSSVSFTATQTSSDFITATAVAFSGGNPASPYDPNAAIPSTGVGPTFTTSNANDILVAAAAHNAAIDSPFTAISPASTSNFLAVGYQIVTSTQAASSVLWGGAIRSSALDAIIKGP